MATAPTIADTLASALSRAIDAARRPAVDYRGQHAQAVLPDGPDFRVLCTCGWFSPAYVDRYAAEREVCAVLVAERERVHRAQRDGEHVIGLLREWALSHRSQDADPGATVSSDNPPEETGERWSSCG